MTLPNPFRSAMPHPAPAMEKNTGAPRRTWLKRLGWAGFLFFLVKGLIWLAIFLGVGRLLGD